jgi:uncharacterized membrane protein YtjA (UPF0391 family)
MKAGGRGTLDAFGRSSNRIGSNCKGDIKVLYYSVVFLVIALVAGALGFGGVAGASAGIAQILFYIFLVLFVISLLAKLLRKA